MCNVPLCTRANPHEFCLDRPDERCNHSIRTSTGWCKCGMIPHNRIEVEPMWCTMFLLLLLIIAAAYFGVKAIWSVFLMIRADLGLWVARAYINGGIPSEGFRYFGYWDADNGHAWGRRRTAWYFVELQAALKANINLTYDWSQLCTLREMCFSDSYDSCLTWRGGPSWHQLCSVNCRKGPSKYDREI